MNNQNNLPKPPLPPDLSSSLINKFNSLSGGGQSLFKKLWGSLWRHLWPVSKLDALSHVYPLPTVLASLSPTIYTGAFLMLSKLWVLSFGGARSVDSRTLNLSSTNNDQLLKLIAAGLIVRSTFDPAHPDLIAFRANQPVFISFTPSGAAFYKNVLRLLDKAVQEDYLNLFRYNIKKGREY